MNATHHLDSHRWLARFAKLTVALTFVLIAIGGHTTTAGAGMAFADWPLSAGSVNPSGWWSDFMQRLEHSHRLMAETVGFLIGVLCAWIWRSKWSIPLAVVVSLAAAACAVFAGASSPIVAHVGLWSSALVFIAVLLIDHRRREHSHSRTLRWLGLAAFIGVCAQAILGGLRVTIEAAGDPSSATVFRVVHGCFAQLELCLLVAIAALLSPIWPQLAAQPKAVCRWAWVTAGVIYLQLIIGAALRHQGAGLAIPTFPHTSPDGTWLPAVHNAFVHLHFSHSRIGALLVTACVVGLVASVLRTAGTARLTRPALLLLALLVAQVLLGMIVIWQIRPPLLTTLHVVNGAALLATTVLLATRASVRSGRESRVPRRAASAFSEVPA